MQLVLQQVFLKWDICCIGVERTKGFEQLRQIESYSAIYFTNVLLF